jgi:hypothetical protein
MSKFTLDFNENDYSEEEDYSDIVASDEEFEEPEIKSPTLVKERKPLGPIVLGRNKPVPVEPEHPKPVKPKQPMSWGKISNNNPLVNIREVLTKTEKTSPLIVKPQEKPSEPTVVVETPQVKDVAPAKAFKTRFCNYQVSGKCRREECFFAHSFSEISECKYGKRCKFIRTEKKCTFSHCETGKEYTSRLSLNIPSNML